MLRSGLMRLDGRNALAFRFTLVLPNTKWHFAVSLGVA